MTELDDVVNDARKREPGAIEKLKELADGHPDKLRFQFAAGLCCQELGLSADARTYLGRAAAIDPAHRATQAALASLASAPSSTAASSSPKMTEISLPATDEEARAYALRIREKERIDYLAQLGAAAPTDEAEREELIALREAVSQVGILAEARAAAPLDPAERRELIRLRTVAAGIDDVATSRGQFWALFRHPVGISSVVILAVILFGAGGFFVWNGLVAPNQTVAIPDVAGMNKVDAIATLTAVGLGPSRQFQLQSFPPSEEIVKDETVPAGTVVGTRPAAGEQISKREVVTLLVADPIGPPGSNVIVPDVTGMTYSDAATRLQSARINYVLAPNANAFGTVLRTEPGAQSAVSPRLPGQQGTQVVIFMSE